MPHLLSRLGSVLNIRHQDQKLITTQAPDHGVHTCRTGQALANLTQHLITDRSDAVMVRGRRDEVANLPLVGVGQACAPIDLGH